MRKKASSKASVHKFPISYEDHLSLYSKDLAEALDELKKVVEKEKLAGSSVKKSVYI